MTECNLKPHTTILVALRPECLHCGLLQNSDLPPDSTRLGHTIYPLPSLHSLVPASCLICNLPVPWRPVQATAEPICCGPMQPKPRNCLNSPSGPRRIIAQRFASSISFWTN